MIGGRVRCAGILGLLLALAACGEPGGDGATDAGPGTDGGAVDGGAVDAGERVDAGADAAARDGGDDDAATPGDAGADAGGGETGPCTVRWETTTPGGSRGTPDFVAPGGVGHAYWLANSFDFRSATVGDDGLVDRDIGEIPNGISRTRVGLATRGHATFLASDLSTLELAIAVIAPDGTVLHGPERLAEEVRANGAPWLVDTPSGVAVLWTENGGQAGLAVLDEAGALDGAIARLPLQSVDEVLWDGDALLVAHRDSERAVLTRVALDGTVLGTLTIPGMMIAGSSRIYGTAIHLRDDGTILLAASTMYWIITAVVQGDLSSATEWTRVIEFVDGAEHVTLAARGSDVFVAWSDPRSSSRRGDVRVARILDASTASPPSTVSRDQLFVGSFGERISLHPVGETDWAVAWRTEPTTGHVARITCTP